MLESGPVRLVRPLAVIITNKKWVSGKFHVEPRDTFGPYDFQNNIKKAVYRAFLTRDYNTKSQKLKKLPEKSKNYKVPHKHDAWNSENGSAWASTAIITVKSKFLEKLLEI
jgi:hypothetical protein